MQGKSEVDARMNRYSFCWCVLLLAAGLSSAGQAPTAKPIDVAVRAGRILDVRTGKYVEEQIIWIEGERIKAMGGAAEIQKLLPAGTSIIDFSGKTVLPGLIDAHTHLTLSAEVRGHPPTHLSFPRQALMGAHNARLTLDAGFTTVRNVAAYGYSDIALRDSINAGETEGPRILASGPAITITGGHDDETTLAPQFNYSSEGVANGVPAVLARVRENVKYGADVIKFMATGAVLSPDANPQAEEFSGEEMNAIVAEAHRLGRKVAAHAQGVQGIKDAVRAGVDSIEHGSYIDEEAIVLMRQHGTYLVPTVFLGEWFLEHYREFGWTDETVARPRAIIAMAQQNLSRAFREGVRVGFGTDAAEFPHGMNAHEFPVMVRLGLTPLQAIQAATVNDADLLGWSDRIGTLEPGKFADLIAVDGDPLQDVTVLEHVQFVMKGGQVIKGP
jgi:imidazolonepropionase-like amidohydrolase